MTRQILTSRWTMPVILSLVIPLGSRGISMFPALARELGPSQNTRAGPVRTAGESRDIVEELTASARLQRAQLQKTEDELEYEKGRRDDIRNLMNGLRKAEEFLERAKRLSRNSADPAIDLVQKQRDEIRAELVRLGREKAVFAQAEKTRRDSEPPGQPGLSARDFVGVRTLKEAVQVVKQDLIGKGKAEYAALLSEERVREAIRSGIRSVEARLDKLEQMNPGSKDHFIGEAKPVFMKILDEGAWRRNCTFFTFYSLGSSIGGEAISYDGFWLRLQVDTPKGKFAGFALPILDISYGKFDL